MKHFRRRLYCCWLVLRGRPAFVLAESRPGHWKALAQHADAEALGMAAVFYAGLAREHAANQRGMDDALAQAQQILNPYPTQP